MSGWDLSQTGVSLIESSRYSIVGFFLFSFFLSLLIFLLKKRSVSFSVSFPDPNLVLMWSSESQSGQLP